MERENRLMVVFPTTTDAMHMQQEASKRKIPGRMVPVPGQIKAGCGLAWCSVPKERPALEKTAAEAGIRTEGFYEILW